MSQADIYVEGFLAQKFGMPERDNPYPRDQQPDHATWWNGWKRGEMASAVGPEGAHRARSEYVALHGSH